MAVTIYFKDGTREVLFHPDSKHEFARILRDKLGTDAEKLFIQLSSDAIDVPDMIRELDEKTKQIETLESDKDDLEDKLNEATKLRYDTFSALAEVSAKLYRLRTAVRQENSQLANDKLSEIQQTLDLATERLRAC